jgi:hypothetical protein
LDYYAGNIDRAKEPAAVIIGQPGVVDSSFNVSKAAVDK